MQFNAITSETPFAIIDRIARFSGMLAYEGRDGNLILNRVGNLKMASGFEQGVNVQSSRVAFTMDERYSEIAVLNNGVSAGGWQIDASAPLVVGLLPASVLYTAADKSVPRYRPRVITSEHSDNVDAVAKQRGDWEIARRYGRSQVATVVCDSWRAKDGSLWMLNTLADLDLPAHKLPGRTWLITEVTFSKDSESGTTAEITLMPPAAFNPEPLILYRYDTKVAEDIAHSGQIPVNGSDAPSQQTPRATTSAPPAPKRVLAQTPPDPVPQPSLASPKPDLPPESRTSTYATRTTAIPGDDPYDTRRIPGSRYYSDDPPVSRSRFLNGYKPGDPLPTSPAEPSPWVNK
jgi:hypothetical protein